MCVTNEALSMAVHSLSFTTGRDARAPAMPGRMVSTFWPIVRLLLSHAAFRQASCGSHLSTSSFGISCGIRRPRSRAFEPVDVFAGDVPEAEDDARKGGDSGVCFGLPLPCVMLAGDMC